MVKLVRSGWDEDKVKRVLEHYETQSEAEAVAEDEAAFSDAETLMQIPRELVADVRALIAERQKEHERK